MTGDALTPAKTWWDPDYNPAGWLAEARRRLHPPDPVPEPDEDTEPTEDL